MSDFGGPLGFRCFWAPEFSDRLPMFPPGQTSLV